MISLLEILHTIEDEKKSGLIPIDKWNWSEADHLATMGFNFTNDCKMQTDKPPYMTVYKKKDDIPDGTQSGSPNKNASFYLEEREKTTKKFKEFNDLIEFFARYPQEEIDDNNG